MKVALYTSRRMIIAFVNDENRILTTTTVFCGSLLFVYKIHIFLYKMLHVSTRKVIMGHEYIKRKEVSSLYFRTCERELFPTKLSTS